MSIKRILLSQAILCSSWLFINAFGQPDADRTLILISFDGFRYDYISRYETPHIDALIEKGTTASALIPVFPTKTFPNHYSIATGLYPAHHGVLSNRMYDPKLEAWFRIGAGSIATTQEKWFGGEPIWITAEKQKVPTATCFWPGSDATFDGIRPTHHFKYNPSMSYDERIDQVLKWLQLEDRPRFISLYFESPDREGHKYGPDAQQIKQAVEELDEKMGRLISNVQELNLTPLINWIIVSDHGMAKIQPDSLIFLDDYVSLSDIKIIERSPKADLIPVSGKEKLIYRQLSNAHPKLKVYKKGQTPATWKFNMHDRIAPIMAIAEEGWTITTRRAYRFNPGGPSGGTHGYEVKYPSMHGIFIAHGPDIMQGKKIPAFENVDLYHLMCKLLRIKPAPNDGDKATSALILN
ncbi:MAG: alkaline phosphatase family protein [Saprospiraceae bacterium]|nr:alkaline phosphatase family protein [Saprospiraceae bacterium]